ncbi:Omega-amidase NIT2-A [Trametes pubescens]|uniref:Omega-amidase NIT2-A n=1 Tax=Trametes pubescens TaxID=154538 RepID=A0A1M2W2Y5_TRAPU|nr:Omega-amidase NIT2-A [Trametes pubescens]
MSSAPAFKPFNLALIQLGQIGPDKDANLKHAREMIKRAAGATPKPDLVVLPECFNSLYGYLQFPATAETISYTPGQPYDVASSESQTVKMLSAAAKEEGVWLIGGEQQYRIPETWMDLTYSQGLFPSVRQILESCTTPLPYTPRKVRTLIRTLAFAALTLRVGELVAMHRKVHLFDIDIPGKIRFKIEKVGALTESMTDPKTFEEARAGIPVTTQRRFDVYPDVSKGL